MNTDIHNIITDTDFQNRFGMHTPAFQELAANVVMFTLSKLDEEHKRVSALQSTMWFPPILKTSAILRGDGRRVHKLKCWPEFYNMVRSNVKRYECRKDDRDFRVGDLLDITEWDPGIKAYTGRSLMREVTYIMRKHPGIACGYCLMSIAPIPEKAPKPLCDADAHFGKSISVYPPEQQDSMADAKAVLMSLGIDGVPYLNPAFADKSEPATAIIAAICNGRVPQIWWYNEDGKVPVMQQKNEQITRLLQENEDLKRRLNVALGPDKDQEEFCSALGKDRDAAVVERDRLAAQVSELTREAAYNRDAAQKLEHCRAELAAMTERAEKAEASCGMLGERALACAEERDATRAEADALKRFKEYTHRLLDEAGVPKYSDKDCRIGARLHHVIAAAKGADAAKAELEKMRAQLATITTTCQGIAIGVPSKWLADKIAKIAAGVEVE